MAGPPAVPTDREIYYSPEVREQTLAIAWIWHSGIYGLNVVYALVASLVRKVQDLMLIKLKSSDNKPHATGNVVANQESHPTLCLGDLVGLPLGSWGSRHLLPLLPTLPQCSACVSQKGHSETEISYR